MNIDKRTIKDAASNYAKSVQVPPVEVLFARAERNSKKSLSPSERTHRRFRRAAWSIPAVVATGALALGGYAVSQNSAQVAASPQSSVNGLAPACPPPPPLLNSSLINSVRPGANVPIPLIFPATKSDREILSISVYVLPAGKVKLSDAVAVKKLTMTPTHVRRIITGQALTLPKALPVGSYTMLESGTYQGPSLCGVPNDGTGSVSKFIHTFGIVSVK